MERPHTSKSGSNNAVDDYATERTKSNEKAANLKTLDEIPDGGWRAWTVVFGSWCCTFLISGWINALGVFQEYYSTELFPQLPTTTVALIPALVEFLVFAGVSVFHGRFIVATLGGHSSSAQKLIFILATAIRVPYLASYTTSMARDSSSPREPFSTFPAWWQPRLLASISTPLFYLKEFVSPGTLPSCQEPTSR